jgi:2-polyprenyl-3-methyl-5-hydroxy-6-metoxy-1,4-benzoquinol methylase
MTNDRPEGMSGLTFYDRNAAVYMQTHAAYHDQRFRTFNMLVPSPPGALFDFGCGSADNLIPLARRGFSIQGVDPSPNLIDLGKTALREAGLDAGAIAVGDVAALEAARPGSIDVVTALNVLAYLTQEEEDRFFRASARALKSTGSLCFSVGNLLSDLVTLNRYTVEFYERHVLGIFAETDAEAREYSDRLRGLLTNAALPAKTTDASYAGRASSERDIVKTRRVILPEFTARLEATFGFGVEAINYYHFWPLPPQVLHQTERLRELQRRFDAVAHDNPLGVVFASQINLRARPRAR